MKKLVAAVFVAFVIGVIWNYLFIYYLLPDTRYWMRCAETSDRWAEALRKTPEPCYVFAGGSEMRTTVDPQQLMDEYGIRAINAAQQAGYSGIVNIEVATVYLRKGDTLVHSLSSYDLSEPPSKTGIRFAWKRRGAAMFNNGLLKPNFSCMRTIVAGDAGCLSLCVIKGLFSGDPIYRYDRDSYIHPSGWMEVRLDSEWHRAPRTFSSNHIYPLSPSALSGFRRLEEICHRKGAHLLLMACLYHRAPEARAAEAYMALSAIRNGFCVLKDERLGCEPRGNLFSDTVNHQNAEGVRRHMHIIGHALKHQLYWTESELIEELHRMGWSEDGTRL